MEETIKERLTAYLKYKGINKSEFGRIIGVSNAYISSIRKSIQPDKAEKIVSSFPDLNIAWLMTGEGEMLKNSTTQTSSGDNSPNISGNGNHVNNAATIDKALNEIAEQRRLVSKSQEQIDRLLGIIEQMTKIKE